MLFRSVAGILTIPPVRKKHPNATLDNTRVRPRALDQLSGLVQSPKCAEMSKASMKGKGKAIPAVAEPDTDMVGSVEIVEEIPQRVSIPHGIGESSKPPPTTQIPSEEGKNEHLYAVSSKNLGVKYFPRAKFSQTSQYRSSWPTRQ